MSSGGRRRHLCVSGARVVVELHGTMTPGEIACVCERVEALLRAEVPVRAQVAAADLAVIDALARMRLWACRLHALFEITGTDDRGRELIELVGLTDALQVDRQPEACEQAGVEEVVDVGDPST
jgi:hypothetical protein